MIFDFNLAANGAQRVEVVGVYIRYKSGAGMIRVNTSNGDYVDLTPGQGMKMKVPFTSLAIRDRSGAANVGILLAGDDEFTDDTLGGAVTVTDDSVKTLAGGCFIGMANMTTTGAVITFAGLWNPGASGKNVILEKLIYSHTADAGYSDIYAHMSQWVPNPAQQNTCYNKKIGGANAAAKAIADTQANIGVIAPSSIFERFNIATSYPFASGSAQGGQLVREFKKPLVLPPGWGVYWTRTAPGNLTNASQSAVTVEFREE